MMIALMLLTMTTATWSQVQTQEQTQIQEQTLTQEASQTQSQAQPTERAEVLLETTEGNITIALYNETPLHRDNFLKLTGMHVYDSLLFHRVIKDFMIQSGDLNSKYAKPGDVLGTGELDYTIEAEFRTPAIGHRRGSVAAAREPDEKNPERRSGACQFYIAWDKASHLDGKYTVFGEVTDGLDVVDKIQQMATDKNDRPLTDVRILKATVTKNPFAVKPKTEANKSQKTTHRNGKRRHRRR